MLRVPGVGVKSAKLIVVSRQYNKLTTENLKKIGVVIKRAQYFITCNELKMHTVNEISPEYVRKALLSDNVQVKKKNTSKLYKQLSLFP